MATAKRVRSTRTAATTSTRTRKVASGARTARSAPTTAKQVTRAVQIDIESIKSMRVLLGGQGVIVPNPPRPKMFTIIVEGIGVVRPVDR